MKTATQLAACLLGTLGIAILAQVFSHTYEFSTAAWGTLTLTFFYVLSAACMILGLVIAVNKSYSEGKRDSIGKPKKWDMASDLVEYLVLSTWLHQGNQFICTIDLSGDLSGQRYTLFDITNFPVMKNANEVDVLEPKMIVEKRVYGTKTCVLTLPRHNDPLPVPTIEDDGSVLAGGDPTSNAPNQPETP